MKNPNNGCGERERETKDEFEFCKMVDGGCGLN